MTQHLLCLGECMIEISETPADGCKKLGYAGDTFNTAWYARKLLPESWTVSYYTAIGRDRMSDAFLSFANEAGLITDRVRRCDKAQMGLYMIHLDKGERSFSYWRGESAARQLADDQEHLGQTMRAADMIYFSGITTAILSKVSQDKLFMELKSARDRGQTIIFDTNLRPKLWADTDSMKASISRFASIATIVLPSFDDEKEYFSDSCPEDTAERYLTNGAEMVVVKNGSGTILVRDQSKTIYSTPTCVTSPVDTTAAGDSFNAGFLSAIFLGDTPETAVIHASNVAADVISATGALVRLSSEFE